MRRLLPAAVLLAVALAVPAQGATVRVQRFSGFRDVTIAGTQTKYRLRLAYVVPATWPRRGTGSAVTRSFGPIGSCRFTVRVTARAVTGPSESAAARLERVQPASGGTPLDSGTRRNFAWSVLKRRGSGTGGGGPGRPAPGLQKQPTRGPARP